MAGRYRIYLRLLGCTGASIGVAAGQILMRILWGSMLAPEFHFLCIFGLSTQSACLVAWFAHLTQDYARPVHVAGRYHIYLRLLGRTGASGWLPVGRIVHFFNRQLFGAFALILLGTVL